MKNSLKELAVSSLFSKSDLSSKSAKIKEKMSKARLTQV